MIRPTAPSGPSVGAGVSVIEPLDGVTGVTPVTPGPGVARRSVEPAVAPQAVSRVSSAKPLTPTAPGRNTIPRCRIAPPHRDQPRRWLWSQKISAVPKCCSEGIDSSPTRAARQHLRAPDLTRKVDPLGHFRATE